MIPLRQGAARSLDRLVLIDGKFGEGLRGLDHLPGIVGPLAAEIVKRYATRLTPATPETWTTQDEAKTSRLVVVVDEVQELISDSAIP